jgi:hypothetical protein
MISVKVTKALNGYIVGTKRGDEGETFVAESFEKLIELLHDQFESTKIEQTEEYDPSIKSEAPPF